MTRWDRILVVLTLTLDGAGLVLAETGQTAAAVLLSYPIFAAGLLVVVRGFQIIRKERKKCLLRENRS